MSDDFKPGLYRHYKGGYYTAIGLVTHHETREPMVLYVSHAYGGLNVRELHGDKEEGVDGWADWLVEHGKRRFTFVSEVPRETPISMLDSAAKVPPRKV